LLALLAAGCQKTFFQVDDPQLKPIQEMIETQLPKGSTTERVTTFLSVRAYELQTPEKPGTLVAIIATLICRRCGPSPPRVTFYFDAEWQAQRRGDERTANPAHRVTIPKGSVPFRTGATFRVLP